jgi:hypothetical protein
MKPPKENKRSIIEKILQRFWPWYFIGFVVPIIFAIICHWGLLFHIPNFIEPLQTLVDFYSKPTENNVAVQILIGIATVSVVFFSFFQFGSNIRHIPHLVVSDYILKHRRTDFLVSFLLSSLSISAFFVLSNKVYNISNAVLTILTVVNLTIIIRYFYWFVKVTRVEDMVNCVLNDIDILSLLDLEKNIISERDKLETHSIIEFTVPFFINPDEDFIIRLNKTGLTTKLDIDKLWQDLEIIKQYIERIECYVIPGKIIQDIGEPFIRLIPKERGRDGQNPSKDENEIREYVIKIREDLKNYITIEKSYELVSKPIDDILKVYEHVALRSNPSDLKDVVHKLYQFISIKEWNRNKGNYSISSHIFKQFVDGFSMLSSNLKPEQLKSLITLIYALRDQAINRDDYNFLKLLISTMNNILWNMLNYTEHYNKYIATFALYYREILLGYPIDKRIKEITQGNENINQDKSKIDYWQKYYSDLISFAFKASFGIMYILVLDYYKRPKEEMRMYIKHNAELLPTLIEQFKNWDKLQTTQNEEKQKEYAQQLIAWSIYTFHSYYYQNKISVDIVTDICFTMVHYCNKRFIYSNDEVDQYIDQFVLDDKLTWEFDRYEEPDLVTAITGIGGTPETANFWIAFSLWRKRYGSGFIPSKNQNDSTKEKAKKLLPKLSKLDRNKLMEILKISSEELHELILQYGMYLQELSH